jgi:phage shock protein PspC (stress-responsive transcriptional regulator)
MASDRHAPTTELPPPPPPPSGRGPLRRTTDDRVIGGVAGGIAEWLDVDVVLVRVAFVVLAVFGGSGLVVYLLAWLFVPADDADRSPVAGVVGRNRLVLWVCGIVVAVLAFAVVSDAWVGKALLPGGMPVLVVLAVAALAYLYLRRRDEQGPDTSAPMTAAVPPAAPSPETAWAAAAPGTTTTAVLPDPPAGTWANATLPLPTSAPGDVATAPTPPPPPQQGGRQQRPPKPPRTPKAPRERSLLGRLTWSALLLVVGVLLAMRFAGVDAVSAVVILGAALLVVGLGLVVGAWVGRSRGLIWLGVLLVVALVPVGFVDHLGSSLRPTGEVTYRPTSVTQLNSSYRSGSGQLKLDLTQLDAPRQTVDVAVNLTAGLIEIDVAPGQSIEVVATAGLGVVRLPGDGGAGDQVGSSVTRTWESAGTGGGAVIRIAADVRVGAVQVRVSGSGPGNQHSSHRVGTVSPTPIPSRGGNA